MIGTVSASPTEVYRVVLALSRPIAGHTDLESLLSRVSGKKSSCPHGRYTKRLLTDMGLVFALGFLVFWAKQRFQHRRMPIV
jgi:hypothetical protein